MARKARTDGKFRVTAHRDKAYVYAITQQWTVDPVSGKKKYHTVIWGTLADGMRFIPGKRFIFATADQRCRLEFPEDWDLGEIDRLANTIVGRPAYTGPSRNRLYGDIWLLEKIAEKTGLKKDLAAVFPGNKAMADAVLTLAMFPYLTSYTYNRVERWQRLVKAPYDKPLDPPSITHLTQRITEADRMELIRLRIGRLGSDDCIAVDSTSRSTYGESLADIRWGKNKEGIRLPQTNDVVAYALKDHTPVYYRSLPGNMPDCRTVDAILNDLSHAGFPNSVPYLTDRGYESLRNLETCIRTSRAFITASRVDRKPIMERISSFRPYSVSPEEMTFCNEYGIYCAQYEIPYVVEGNGAARLPAKKLRLSLFFDPVRRSEEAVALESDLYVGETFLTDLLRSGEPHKGTVDALKQRCRYFTLTFSDDGRLVSFSKDEKKIAKARLLSGFFANTSHMVDKDAVGIYEYYKMRDEQEKYFSIIKSQMGFNRQRAWSEEGRAGKEFILFVGLILASHVRHIWKTKLRNVVDTSIGVLDEMRSIRCVEEHHRAKFITPFVGKQVQICKAFGIDIPDRCAPGYTSRKAREKKRGRPPKKTVDLDS